MKVKELREIAKKENIKFCNTYTKNELIDLLNSLGYDIKKVKSYKLKKEALDINNYDYGLSNHKKAAKIVASNYYKRGINIKETNKYFDIFRKNNLIEEKNEN